MSESMKASLRQLRPVLLGSLRLLDCFLVAFILYVLADLHIGEWFDRYEDLALVASLFSLLTFHYSGVYKVQRGQKYLGEFKAILTAWLAVGCLLLFLLFVFKLGDRYSRVVLISWLTITPIVIFLLHAFLRKLLRELRAQGVNIKNAVIVGASDLGLSLAEYIEDISWSGIKILGFFDDTETTENCISNKQSNVIGKINDLLGFLQNNSVDFIYIALPMREEKRICEVLNTCRTHGARMYLVPDLNSFRFFNGRVQHLGNVILLDFNPDSELKSLFDLCFASLAILITLPLTLTIAAIIKLSDRGPVFYRHRRITVTGKEFYCLKFRTMRVDADKKLKEILDNDDVARKEWEQAYKLKKDPRITRIGRFLRKTCLDELPQFVNVIRGEMSVVGARPIVHHELCEYYKENGGIYCSIKPGITGIWQVSPRRNAKDYQERIKMDVWYAVNRDFWLDLKIIYLTLVCMARRDGM